jgi:signal transduction histidine kinase
VIRVSAFSAPSAVQIAQAFARSRSEVLDSGRPVAGDLRRYVESVLPKEAASEVLRRLEAAKLESLAEFAAGAGHEINNPLAVISGRAAMLLRDESDPERRRLLATIGAQALRIRDMIGDLMVFGRPPQPAPVELDLAEIARTVVDRFVPEVSPEVSISCCGDETAPVWADHTQLCVVIEALIRNSLEALDGSSGRIEIESRRPAESSSEFALVPLSQLLVRDTGCGLSDVDRQHLFDPFYSGRPAGRGLGFGLSKCWRIVTLHGGRIEVESAPPHHGSAASAGPASDDGGTADSTAAGWTTFRVLWPAGPCGPDR